MLCPLQEANLPVSTNMLNLVFRAIAHWGGLDLASKAFPSYGGMGLHPNTDTFNTILAATLADKRPVATLNDVMLLMEREEMKRVTAAGGNGGGRGSGKGNGGGRSSVGSSTKASRAPSCKPDGLSYGILLKAAAAAKDWKFLGAVLEKMEGVGGVKLFADVPAGWLDEVAEAAHRDGAGEKLAPLAKVVRGIGASRAVIELGVMLGKFDKREGYRGARSGRGGEKDGAEGEAGGRVRNWSVTKAEMMEKQEALRKVEGKERQQGKAGSHFAAFLNSSGEGEKEQQGGDGQKGGGDHQQQQGAAAVIGKAAGSGTWVSPGFLAVSRDAAGALELAAALERGEVKDAAAVAAAAAEDSYEDVLTSGSSSGSSSSGVETEGISGTSTEAGDSSSSTSSSTTAGGLADADAAGLPGVGEESHGSKGV